MCERFGFDQDVDGNSLERSAAPGCQVRLRRRPLPGRLRPEFVGKGSFRCAYVARHSFLPFFQRLYLPTVEANARLTKMLALRDELLALGADDVGKRAMGSVTSAVGSAHERVLSRPDRLTVRVMCSRTVAGECDHT